MGFFIKQLPDTLIAPGEQLDQCEKSGRCFADIL